MCVYCVYVRCAERTKTTPCTVRVRLRVDSPTHVAGLASAPAVRRGTRVAPRPGVFSVLYELTAVLTRKQCELIDSLKTV